MSDRHKPIALRAATGIILSMLFIGHSSSAFADIVGRLHILVKNAADEKPISGAKITLKDSAGVRSDVTLTSGADGSATSPPLETRPWQVTAAAEKFETDTPRSVTVVADTVTDVEVLLEPAKGEKVIRITAARELVQKSNVSSSKQVDQSAIQKFAPNAGNPQDMRQAIARTTPGIALDSVNQGHPRGEHSATSIMIDGFQLGGAMQGRGGPLLSPDVVQNINVMTGGYAPEYGSELGAVLNLSLRAGTIKPLRSYLIQGGEYGTLFGNLTIGGQGGKPIGQQDAVGGEARSFGYFLNINGRRTDNALEPPQPDDQDSHNHGEAQTYFGHFTKRLGNNDNLSLTANASPAYTQIANRSGLPDSFADVGQGYGFAGHLSRTDAAAAGLLTQQQLGQDVFQRDANEFGTLQWRHTFSNNTNSLISFGLNHAGLDILNSNPGFNIANLQNNNAADPNNPFHDSSIEFNPTIHRNSHNIQVQGSVTKVQGKHTFKAGLLTDEQENNESYNFVPTSQLAVNALAAVDPRLLPPGTLTGDTDELGTPVYQLTPGGGGAPTVMVHQSGFYRAGYLQDTWNVDRRLTANYGVRLDWYKTDVNVGGTTDSIDTMHLSPRLNLAYLLAKQTIGRLSYNRLFTQPPLAQSAVLGLAVPPQTGDMYEASVEKQLKANQTAKVAFYYKDWRDFLDTGLFLPGTQIGAYSTFSHPHVLVRGIEFSYDLQPRGGVGVGAFVTWAHSINRLLAPEEGPTDHDQLNTINFGLDYTFRDQSVIGMSLYHGSGVASSVVHNGERTPRTIINLRVASRPNLFGGAPANGRGGLELSVENITDDRSVINFASAFSGTRFQQGRRILLGANGKF
jgi:hypothetical protein